MGFKPRLTPGFFVRTATQTIPVKARAIETLEKKRKTMDKREIRKANDIAIQKAKEILTTQVATILKENHEGKLEFKTTECVRLDKLDLDLDMTTPMWFQVNSLHTEENDAVILRYTDEEGNEWTDNITDLTLSDIQGILYLLESHEDKETEKIRGKISALLIDTDEDNPIDLSGDYLTIGEDDAQGISSLELPRIMSIFQVPGEGTIWVNIEGMDEPFDTDHLTLDELKRILEAIS